MNVFLYKRGTVVCRELVLTTGNNEVDVEDLQEALQVTSFAAMVDDGTINFDQEVLDQLYLDPYPDSACPYCDKTMKSPAGLKNHIRSAHPEEMED